MNRIQDKYQDEIDRLTTIYNEEGETAFEIAVRVSWNYPEGGKQLFGRCSPNRIIWFGNTQCGCLTQVKYEMAEAYTPLLTAMIRSDDRIPTSPYTIKEPADLEVFAEWQRKMDAMFTTMKPNSSVETTNV